MYLTWLLVDHKDDIKGKKLRPPPHTLTHEYTNVPQPSSKEHSTTRMVPKKKFPLHTWEQSPPDGKMYWSVWKVKLSYMWTFTCELVKVPWLLLKGRLRRMQSYQNVQSNKYEAQMLLKSHLATVKKRYKEASVAGYVNCFVSGGHVQLIGPWQCNLKKWVPFVVLRTSDLKHVMGGQMGVKVNNRFQFQFVLILYWNSWAKAIMEKVSCMESIAILALNNTFYKE